MAKVKIRFIESPTGAFRLAYNAGDVASIDDKLAQELFDAGYAVPASDDIDLPKDLPGREVFGKLGLSLDEIKHIKVLTDLEGISKSIATKVKEFLSKE